MPDSDPVAFLPLSHLSYHVLLALRSTPLHGYAVVKAVKASSAGVISPGTGTFYSAMHRLVREGLIDQTDGASDTKSDSRRKHYDLTQLGHMVLDAETRRLESVLSQARAAAGASP
ncbi:MAG: helix-turn-helix transcriptional regulator [Gemmatimonadales bacterium]